MKKSKKLSDYERYSSNPLVDMRLLKSKFKMIHRPDGLQADKAVLDKGTGEVAEMQSLVFTKKYIYDSEKFTKVFHNTTKEFFNFTKNTSELFWYIRNECAKPDNDIFFINYKEAALALGHKQPNCVFNSLKELIEKKVIARGSMVNQYYINPHIFFNGSRVKYVKLIENQDKGKNTPDNEFVLPEMSFE